MEVRPLLSSNMTRQQAMLLSALVPLRKSLRDLEPLLPTASGLGARHVGYGARREHYPVVGETLLAAMAALAGEDWKPSYERAWSAAFEIVAAAMLEGAEGAEGERAA